MFNAFPHVQSVVRRSLLFALILHISASGMVFDNRFIPLQKWQYITVDDRPSHFAFAPFAVTASNAYGCDDDLIGIPGIYGKFDLGVLAQSMFTAGIPLTADLTYIVDQNVPFLIDGKIQGQGLELRYQQAIGDYISLGFSWFCMRSTSWNQFRLDKSKMTINSELTADDCDQALRDAFNLLGFNDGYARQAGSGDFDIYARLGKRWDYSLKCRAVSVGGRLGLLAPAGVSHSPCNPASIPYGGNGHWGMYGAFDADVELKEDMKIGGLLRLNKRFARTSLQRMAVGQESSLFGVVQGSARVNPGCTVIFSPYASLEGLRGGLGFRLNYTLTKHYKDSWQDCRADKSVPVNIVPSEVSSTWASDYFAVNVFYDFGKDKQERQFEPILLFTWDVPAHMLVANRVAKTNRISLGLEFSF